MRPASGKLWLIFSMSLIYFSGTLIFCPDSFAAGETSQGRTLWDNIMLIVNFGILVFFFLKYGRIPLMDFLRGQKKRVEGELNEVNVQFKDVKTLMEEEAEKLEDIDKLIEEIKKNIIKMGKREKENII